MKTQTLRTFNEQSQIFGLTPFDLVILSYVLVSSFQLLETLNLELISFILTGTLSLFLIHLRLTYRRKIIRDTVLFYILPRNLNASWRLK